MTLVITNPTSIQDWAEAAIKTHAFYVNLGCDELEAMRLTAIDIRDTFERVRLHLSFGEAQEDPKDAYTRGYEDGRQEPRE